MSSQAPVGGFSLFPNTNRPPSRTQASRPRASTPQGDPSSATEVSPPRNGRETPLGRSASRREGKQAAPGGRQSALDGRISPDYFEEPVLQRPAPVADVPPRSETAFSEAQTLVRGSSTRSRSSIAKLPFPEEASSSQREAPALRSIFPQYNPTLPVDRQDYYPTQASPTHIPRGVISRPLYSPTEADHQSVRTPQGLPARSVPVERPPMSGNAVSRSWPLRVQEPPVVPTTTSTDELRGLWKVTNGWKAAPTEGRVYCLRMTSEKDAPIYTLSSDAQPFYHLRMDPTSASAYVTVMRHDPSKPYRGNAPEPIATSPGGTPSKPENKNWQEALTTTLEEESRKHPPNDGLVALLYPTAAARRALEAPHDATTVLTAERECARLVWDEDSASHFLVHPALALPFVVTVERNPTWSRTEYTLEHLESPAHLARLTRDGTGEGWLEVDTAIAGKIDSIYLVDVAVTALMLVAHSDAAFQAVELFEPPPSFPPPLAAEGDVRRGSSRLSRASGRLKLKTGASARDADGGGGSGGGKRAKKQKHGGRSRMEEFEMDIESQASELGKSDVRVKTKKQDDLAGLPWPLRALVKVLKLTFKCFIWIATMGFRAVVAIFRGLAKCLTGGKL